jgi:hypothetical protein
MFDTGHRFLLWSKDSRAYRFQNGLSLGRCSRDAAVLAGAMGTPGAEGLILASRHYCDDKAGRIASILVA